jgi:hypothetical protein
MVCASSCIQDGAAHAIGLPACGPRCVDELAVAIAIGAARADVDQLLW